MTDKQLPSPTISIITPSLNGASTIGRTIDSVAVQTLQPMEHILIDGGSTDGTVDIIKRYEDKITHWVSEPDFGLYHAMNKGILASKGDIIGIVNADDYYFPRACEMAVEAFKGKTLDEHIVWGDVMYGKKRVKGWRAWNLKRGAFAPHPSMFCPRKVYDKIGLYKLCYKISGDYEFMYRAVNACGIKPLYVAEPFAYFSDGGLASRNVFRALTEEMLIKIEHGQSIGTVFPLYLLKVLKNMVRL